MKCIRELALVLCALLLAAGISASSSNDVFRDGININAAMRTYSPDTVMLSSGGLFVTWGEFYFLLHSTAGQLTGDFTDNVDWDEPSPDGYGTMADLVKEYVIEQGTQSLVYKYAVRETGLVLDENDLFSIQSALDSLVADAESSEALERELNMSGIINLSVYESLLHNFILQDRLPAVFYGDMYDQLPDGAVESFALRNNYMRAKHILITFLSEYDGYTLQEIEDAKAEAYNKLEGLLADLSPHLGKDSLYGRFDELVSEHSEDPGSFSYPDGYLFQPQDMVAPFSDACMALGYGEVSGIVETSYGYHIILRLPLDYDNLVPLALASSGQYYTLRQLAIFDDYDQKLSAWYDSMSFEYSPALYDLDVGKLFKWHD